MAGRRRIWDTVKESPFLGRIANAPICDKSVNIPRRRYVKAPVPRGGSVRADLYRLNSPVRSFPLTKRASEASRSSIGIFIPSLIAKSKADEGGAT